MALVTFPPNQTAFVGLNSLVFTKEVNLLSTLGDEGNNLVFNDADKVVDLRAGKRPKYIVDEADEFLFRILCSIPLMFLNGLKPAVALCSQTNDI